MPRAILLAAGRGERMRPLTDDRPKPLLEAGGKALIEWQLERLVAAGFDDVVINHSHLGAMIEQRLGDGRRHGARIRYSPESAALETAGGVAQALRAAPHAGAILVVSADIFTRFDYASLLPRLDEISRDPAATCAHFVLVDNPAWHPQGDMGLAGGRVTREQPLLTYGNISLFHASLFEEVPPQAHRRIFPWAYGFVEAGRVTGEHFRGEWDNVGTPEQLALLRRRLDAGGGRIPP